MDRAARRHDDVAGEDFFGPVPLNGDAGHLAARCAGEEPADTRVGQQRDVRVRERWIDANHLRVALAVHETWKAVACVATNASTFVRVRLVEHDAERNVEGPQSALR